MRRCLHFRSVLTPASSYPRHALDWGKVEVGYPFFVLKRQDSVFSGKNLRSEFLAIVFREDDEEINRRLISAGLCGK